MKRIFSFVIVVFLAATLLFSVSVTDKIAVVLDGKQVFFDVPPQIINDRTLVSARFAAEAFGGKVSWDGATRTVYMQSAAAMPVSEKSSSVCSTHTFDVRGYCTRCGFASDYQVVNLDASTYIVQTDTAEKRARLYRGIIPYCADVEKWGLPTEGTR